MLRSNREKQQAYESRYWDDEESNAKKVTVTTGKPYAFSDKVSSLRLRYN